MLPQILYFIEMATKTDHRPQYWFIFHEDRIVTNRRGAAFKLLNVNDIQHIKPLLERQHKLGQFESFDAFCAEISRAHHIQQPLEAISFKRALDVIGEDWYSIATKAYAIINWDKNHQFCGRCGASTIQTPGTFERICTQCTQPFYPRISPSVVVRIRKGDEILMARSHHFVPGAYGLIAGFVEAGESLEETVHREVLEEVNIKVNNLQYYSSQAWPFPDSLMVGFTADYASGELIIDSNEIETASWYRYDQLPGRPSTHISISSKLIDDFINLHKG